MEKRKITILHIHEKFYPHMGGSTHRLLNLLQGMDVSEFNIIVLCLRVNDASDYEEYKGIKIFRFDHYYEIPSMMKKILKENNIDIIHSHNFRPTFYSKLYNHKLPHIMEMHSIYEPNGLISKCISKIIYKLVDNIIVLSQTSKEYLINNYSVAKDKIYVVLNGLLNNEVQNNCVSKLSESIPDNTINLSYIGSLDDFQGINNIVKLIGATQNPNIFYTIIGGEIDESEELKSKIGKRNNVLIKSYIAGDEVPSIYSKTDYLLVLRPSCLMTDTAIPLKPLEALKYGSYVISTNVGGMVELANDLKTQKILFFNNMDDIIDYVNNKIKKIIKIDRKSDVSIEKYTTREQSAILANIYRKLVDKNEVE